MPSIDLRRRDSEARQGRLASSAYQLKHFISHKCPATSKADQSPPTNSVKMETRTLQQDDDQRHRGDGVAEMKFLKHKSTAAAQIAHAASKITSGT